MGWSAQWSRALEALVGATGSVSASKIGPQLSWPAVLGGNLTLSSGFHRHQACTWYINTQAGRNSYT